MNRMLTLGSLFDGCGGFPLAASNNGIKTLWLSEIDPKCIKVTAKRFPEAVQLGDVTRINGAEIPQVDIISFGSPCQNISIAGNKKGINGDESRLFFESVRIIKEMRDKSYGRYPTIIIWENVENALRINGGKDFKVVLTEMFKALGAEIVLPDLTEWGRNGLIQTSGQVGGGYRILDPRMFGEPARRERLFTVVCKKPYDPRKILHF